MLNETEKDNLIYNSFRAVKDKIFFNLLNETSDKTKLLIETIQQITAEKLEIVAVKMNFETSKKIALEELQNKEFNNIILKNKYFEIEINENKIKIFEVSELKEFYKFQVIILVTYLNYFYQYNKNNFIILEDIEEKEQTEIKKIFFFFYFNEFINTKIRTIQNQTQGAEQTEKIIFILNIFIDYLNKNFNLNYKVISEKEIKPNHEIKETTTDLNNIIKICFNISYTLQKHLKTY